MDVELKRNQPEICLRLTDKRKLTADKEMAVKQSSKMS